MKALILSLMLLATPALAVKYGDPIFPHAKPGGVYDVMTYTWTLDRVDAQWCYYGPTWPSYYPEEFFVGVAVARDSMPKSLVKVGMYLPSASYRYIRRERRLMTDGFTRTWHFVRLMPLDGIP